MISMRHESVSYLIGLIECSHIMFQIQHAAGYCMENSHAGGSSPSKERKIEVFWL